MSGSANLYFWVDPATKMVALVWAQLHPYKAYPIMTMPAKLCIKHLKKIINLPLKGSVFFPGCLYIFYVRMPQYKQKQFLFVLRVINYFFMKNPSFSGKKRKFFLFVFILPLALSVHYANGQTMGTLTFTSGTSAPNANYGTKHVLAVWLENTANPSVFIKTKAKYGNEDDHLTSWVAKSGRNLVDAVTGATLSAYNPVTISWNATNTAGTVVPDGTYNVYIEMGWGSNKTNDHAVNSFTFTKGPDAQHLTPTSTTNYSNVTVDWVPVSTLSEVTEDFENLCIFPNPSSGLVNITFARDLKRASIKIVNSQGKTVFSERYYKLSAGPKKIDLRNYPGGFYIFHIESDENPNYNYKVLLSR